MLKLRDYQGPWITKIKDAFNRGVEYVMGVLATGGGKTISFAALVYDHLSDKRGGAAIVVHRKEIVVQISRALGRLGVKHRVVAPPEVLKLIRRKHLKEFGKSFIDPHALCGVVSVQTLTSKGSEKNSVLQNWLKQVTLAVFDEGHHYVKTGLWARAVMLMASASVLFVTATPERADGKGLGEDWEGFAQEMIQGPDVKDLQDTGWLCRFTYKAPKSDLDLRGIPVTATGDLNTMELRKRVVKSHLVGDVVVHYKEYLGGKRAIVFATDVQTANDMGAAFLAGGVKAVALSGETEQDIRDRAIEDFEDGKVKVLINVDLFDEGFDVPAADGCILARPTESLAKYLQMVGRVLRPMYAKGFELDTVAGRFAAIAASVKPFAIVIDPVRNWERHGMPNWRRKWTLEGKSKESRGPSDTIPQKACLACTQPYGAYLLACKYCGHVNEPAGRASIEQVDGALHDLDVDAMAAVFERIRKAEMNDDEFRLTQITRRVPPIGRGAELARHNAAKYRRQVLRELVAWWVGCQPNRHIDEIHKRFYYRFGVDIGTAFTLDQKDTDALIDVIKSRFHQDICEVH
jgi:DNA repair protein RadD